MEKLKPCPFCGGTPEMKIKFPVEYGGNIANVFVQCKGPLCDAEGAKITVMKECVKRALESSSAMAAALWNRREGVAGATVRRGEWLGLENPVEDYKAMCSVCGYTSPPTNFCPHCGAKMDLDAEG